MSLYDKATIVQIPSGVMSGTLYNVLPNTADGDFDFTRATSATRVNKDGLIESVASGVPRLDYPLIDGVVQSCPALLLEPIRENELTDSEDFTEWDTTQNATLTSDNATSPDGSVNATKITDDSTSGNHRLFTSLTTTAADHTFSIYLKKGTMTTAFLRFLSGSDIATANVDLEAGTITATAGTAKIYNAGNDWYRCSITGTAAAGTSYVYVYMKQLAGYAGTSQDLFLWGAQVEAGSYETSYIPTSGSTVTRNADVCKDAGTSAEFNDSEGVLFVEIAALDNDGTQRRISINDNVSDSNRVFIGFTSTDNQIQGQSRTGTSTQAALDHTVSDVTDFHKVAIKYKANDFALWIDGVEVDTDGGGTAPENLSILSFDRKIVHNFYGKVKQVMVFNEALTDAELTTLTS